MLQDNDTQTTYSRQGISLYFFIFLLLVKYGNGKTYVKLKTAKTPEALSVSGVSFAFVMLRFRGWSDIS